MVEEKTVRRCKTCTNGEKAVEDGYTICEKKHCKVWSDSIACNDYDDTEIFELAKLVGKGTVQ